MKELLQKELGGVVWSGGRCGESREEPSVTVPTNALRNLQQTERRSGPTPRTDKDHWQQTDWGSPLKQCTILELFIHNLLTSLFSLTSLTGFVYESRHIDGYLDFRTKRDH